jgi:hypothetical protein
MAKEYLSKNERANFIYLLFFEDFLKNEVLSKLKNTYFSKDEVTNMKKALTWISKANISLIQRIDKENFRAILNASKVNSLELMPTTEMQFKINRILSDKHHVETLTEAAMYKCYECSGKQEQCDLRDTLKTLNVDIIGNENKDICVYKFIYAIDETKKVV